MFFIIGTVAIVGIISMYFLILRKKSAKETFSSSSDPCGSLFCCDHKSALCPHKVDENFQATSPKANSVAETISQTPAEIDLAAEQLDATLRLQERLAQDKQEKTPPVLPPDMVPDRAPAKKPRSKRAKKDTWNWPKSPASKEKVDVKDAPKKKKKDVVKAPVVETPANPSPKKPRKPKSK